MFVELHRLRGEEAKRDLMRGVMGHQRGARAAPGPTAGPQRAGPTSPNEATSHRDRRLTPSFARVFAASGQRWLVRPRQSTAAIQQRRLPGREALPAVGRSAGLLGNFAFRGAREHDWKSQTLVRDASELTGFELLYVHQQLQLDLPA